MVSIAHGLMGVGAYMVGKSVFRNPFDARVVIGGVVLSVMLPVLTRAGAAERTASFLAGMALAAAYDTSR